MKTTGAVKIIATVLMLFFGMLMIVPFLWMISTSFKTPAEVFEYPIRWIPAHFNWEHHVKVWTGNNSFTHYYLNSLKISLISVAGAVLLSSLAAYGFSRIEFKGRNALFMVYLSMMMVPPQVLFVPKFIMFDWAGIYNTHWALILPGMFTIFGVFMMRQFFLSVPQEISEAAFIDGAGHFRIFFRLILPLAKPALATLAIIDFSWHWNDYENALVFLIDQDLFTVPLGLQNFILENTVDYNGMMAAATAGIIPMILVFLIGQKYIIQGVSSSAVKG
ncbi:carbohydrate ABC transporter permease [Paenibacillus macerans]|uniref:Binding--dependent transport system inner membrane component family protein n=1 Tax=Paenibacillus macerans TaxID=44252 RepID=A0A090YNV9_PAEMA|nr:carbohydrate ABC transporter permease [Paenibacillus macerans]KFM93835.1 binding--dependent transport system inner membrane component family protein [Paenibacillus macerans]MBS5911187.1 carbohydrate ABC transporter permease [Paenibacillus macerans]MCY7562076.1 carbohydrate ABC transporter permease [Paenibacillus macerans]MEC0153833.1 carbohydrate ABC transporter permease [Paenibacillus macerans]SUA86338.1 binding-protein-dependent transport systems inner membrane component [Paenibacillus ma